MEIILSVGLLSLVSVYVLQIYVTSHRLNQQAVDVDESVQLANSLIQVIDQAPSEKALAEHPLLQQAVLSHGQETLQLVQHYDDTWTPNDGTESVYQLIVSIMPHKREKLTHIDMTIKRVMPYMMASEEETALYHLNVIRYHPESEVVDQ